MDKSNRVMGGKNSPLASGGAQGNLTSGVDLGIDPLAEAEDDDDDRDFDAATGGKFAKRVGVKLKSLYSTCTTCVGQMRERL